MSNSTGAGEYHCENGPLSNLAYFLEVYFEIPVIDRTGLNGTFDINLTWPGKDWEKRDREALKRALIEQLGLELAPSREPVEMLIVEKAK
jgi:uncharacterized protein (TIGR03435 family)